MAWIKSAWIGPWFIAVTGSRDSWCGVRLLRSKRGWCVALGVTFVCVGVGKFVT